MNTKKTAETNHYKLVLPIFAALCALFASGAIIGITVLSNPALEWKLITALLPQYAVCFAIAFLVIYGYGSILPTIAYVTLPVSCLVCGVRTAYASAPYVSALTIALIFVPLTAAAVTASLWALQTPHFKKSNSIHSKASSALSIAGVCIAATVSLALFAVMWNGRIQSLQTNGTLQAQYGQMLYYMQNSGLPFTTLAAAQPQSWFLTQFSPLWYIVLPVYVLSGHDLLATGMTLYTLMLTALIPLWRICRRNTLSPGQTAALCAACALCPLIVGGGASGGSLTMLSLPLLLWVADALESKHPYLALIPLILCFGIGIEIAIWTPFVCLYLMLRARPEAKRAGWICTAAAVLGLIATIVYLAIVQSHTLTGLFSGIGLQLGQKLLFLVLLLLPFALLPLLAKQKEALVLLIPFALFHLVANAASYSGIFSTYAYPSVAAALLLSVTALGKIDPEVNPLSLRKLLPAVALCTSILLATPYVALLDQLYLVSDEQATDATQMQDLLDKLPQNASVTASDSLLCELHDRTWLFSLNADPEHPDTNVIVLDLREDIIPSSMEGYDVAYYQSLGYTLRKDLSADGLLAVLFK